MEMPEHIWFLMSRNLSGEATTAEKEELMQLLQQQPTLQQQFDILKRWWESQHITMDSSVETSAIENILKRSSQESAAVIELPEPRRRGLFRSIYGRVAIVAGLLIAVTGAVVVFSKKTTPAIAMHEVLAPKGSRTRTILPDGSTVWLNAGSKISYKPGLTGTTREVTLEGEAYFDVVKRTGRSFVVHTKEIDISVLGTAFNVKSYPNDKTIETTLIRGLVSITRNNDKEEKPVYLHPHQKFVLSVNGANANDIAVNPNTITTQSVRKDALRIIDLDKDISDTSRTETAWIYDRLEFRGDSFEDLAKKLERWYNINIRFEDEKVKQLTFNGSLEIETVEEAFKALRAATLFNYTINENEISVRSN